MPHRVVITGIGPITGIGTGKELFWRSLLNAAVVASPIPADFERNASLNSRWYVPLPAVSLGDHDLRFCFENAMQHEDRMAVLGAKLALEDAAFTMEITDTKIAVQNLDRCSVLIGIGLGGLQTAFDSYLAHRLSPEQLTTLTSLKKLKFNRMVIPATMPNSPAAWVSICCGIHGQSSTLNASCASGTMAVGEAYRRIHDGYDDVVVSGGVECLKESSGAIMRGFDQLGALTRSADGLPRPFSKNRSGFLFSEGGACMLVMESWEHARARSARIYAEIIDYHACSDAANIVQIEKQGVQITNMLREITGHHTIDYFNAHGTGTETNDAVEALAIQTVFGDMAYQPHINATKGTLGHTLGASGALEAAVTALSIHNGIMPGTITDTLIDNLNVPVESIEYPVTTALTVSYGFGGHNGALLLKKVDRNG